MKNETCAICKVTNAAVMPLCTKCTPGNSDAVRALVNEQANDDGLWFHATRITEAYLQQELRRLHAAIEGEP